MSYLSASRVRQRVAAPLADLAGWRESRWSQQLFRSDPRPGSHLSYAVGISASGLHSGERRQRRSEGLLVETAVTVTFSQVVKGDDMNGSQDAALDAIELVIRTVLGASRNDLHLLYSNYALSTAAEGYIVADVEFRAIHRITLT